MNEPIFVYGTLKRGERNHARYAADVDRVEAACVRGVLYHLPDGYPAFRRRPNGTVFGELLHFRDPAIALPRLDTLEGFRADDPDGSLYHRMKCDAQPLGETGTPVGTLIPAWIYVYAQPLPAGAGPLPNGRWSETGKS